MANTEELPEHPLTRYARHFDIWLEDFKETSSYADIVIGHDGHWGKIYRELDQIFKDTVWNPMKLRNETSTNVDDQRRSSDSERDYRREFDKWLTEFKKTSVYWGMVAGYKGCWSKIDNKLHQTFKMNVWNPT